MRSLPQRAIPGRPRRPFAPLTFAWLLLLIASSTPACRAGFVVTASTNIQVLPGSTGFFDVTIADTDPVGSSPRLVAGFQLELRVSPSSGVTFTGATSATSSPYLFQDHSANDTYGLPFASPDSTPTDLMLSDTVDQFGIFTTIRPGGILGLARVFFAVAAGSPLGPVDLQVVPFSANSAPEGTLIGDQNGATIATTSLNGQITVVPEPTSLLLSLSGLALCLVRTGMRRRGGDSRSPPRIELMHQELRY